MTPNKDNNNPAIIAANAIASSLFLGHNGEWWDKALIGGLALATVVAGVVVLATAGQIVSHKREAAEAKAELTTFKLATEARVSEANTKLEEAAERIAASEERAAKLAVALELAKNNAKQIDANLLREQRFTANERWRLERIERAVLPRSDFVEWGRLAKELKSLKLSSISIVKYGEGNFEVNGFWINLVQAFRQAGVSVSTFAIDGKLSGIGPSSSGLTTITVDAKGQEVAQMLWEKFQIGGGSSSVFPDGFIGVPKDVNCLVVGPRDGGVGPGSGQPGEGIDAQGRPVPSP